MVEGLGKGAGLALLAVPMADAFIFSQAQFQRISFNYFLSLLFSPVHGPNNFFKCNFVSLPRSHKPPFLGFVSTPGPGKLQ
jgi:hypothetical protein